MKVFIDDAGNTGINVWDLQQPIYVTTGLALSDAAIAELELAINNAKARLNIPSNCEIKMSNLLRSTRGKKEALYLLKRLLSLSEFHCYSIVEKKFLVAARLVDELLDPEYNTKVHVRFYPGEEHKEAAYWVCKNIPLSLLSRFFSAYIKRDAVELISVRDELSPITKNANDKFNLVHLISEITNEEISENFCQQDQQSKSHESPNYTAFFALINIIDAFVCTSPESWIIVHDETKEFQKLYNNIVEIRKRGETGLFRLGDTPPLALGKNASGSISFLSSKANTGLICADFLSSSFRWALERLIASEEQVEEEIVNLISFLIAGSLLSGCYNGTAAVSEDLIIKVARHAKDYDPKLKRKSE